ncbi:MAG: glutamate 5-kinase [Gammaproteobacteria bacterium]
MTDRINLGRARRWVIKIGSALITNEGKGLDTVAIQRWAEQMSQLRAAGKELLLVSSGAVAEGMSRMGITARPHALHQLQAAAALGQMGLIQHFESCFQQHQIHTAQVLLTHEDLSNRQRYLNARSTLTTLLQMGAIPIINENDTVATDEIRFGDNDTLAALVANLVEADALIILTDQQGLYNKDPRQNPDAELIGEANAADPAIMAMAGAGGNLGRGGMRTKITAAQRAARSGAATLIASGRTENVLLEIARGAETGTLLSPKTEKLAARKQWLASHLVVSGSLQLDQGASKALAGSGVSLLAVGVTGVNGNFNRGDMVNCVSPDGQEIARGLVNYAADEARKIMGKASQDIEKTLGYVDEPELIHRDNLVLL